jgi:sn-glycerol 3-phosphate transport system ATP-binding protein
VQIRDVFKRYGNTEVIHGVSLDIDDGEFVVVVGPSGCGKSTLLRMIAGLETITDGEIAIDGQRVNELEPKDRNIAMVFQNYALYPHMSVFDNMAYGLRNRKVAEAEIKRKVAETAAILELDGLLQRRPSQLSGGQRQRVAMGRAIVRQPKVFLFDEPLSNLDAKLRVNMRIEIRRLQRELGITSVYVTHDQVEAMTLADRLVAMNAGHAEQVGAPLDIYEQPASRFVAGFIGSPPMNFLDAVSGDDGVTVAGARLGVVAGVDVHGPFTLGVRPEHVALTAAGEGMLAAEVELVEPLGAETLVHTRIDGARDELLTVRVHGHPRVSAGERVGLRFDTARIRAFAAA